MDRIFVQIPSYRDTECQWTVKDLYEKAFYPERIFTGICWQYDPDADRDCFAIAIRPQQVRTAHFHVRESRGLCWARNQTQQLWRGEEYTLYIDSHMRFVPGWDEDLIKQLAECPSAKPVLSNHPAAYVPPNELSPDLTPTVLHADPYTVDGDIRINGAFLSNAPERPLRGAFVAGGFLFGRSSCIEDVPYDPYLYFNQDEMALSLRLFTHGYDAYSPRKTVLYHYYTLPENDVRTKKRPYHWDDHNDWHGFHELARKRFDHLVGYCPSDDPMVIRDLDRYGLGGARTLQSFELFTGIDFRKRLIGERALKSRFIEGITHNGPAGIHIPQFITPPPAPVTVTTFPDSVLNGSPEIIALPGDTRTPHARLDPAAPPGVLLVRNFLDRRTCEQLKAYADAQPSTRLHVENFDGSFFDDSRETYHVGIDGAAFGVLSIFNDIYCNRVAPFYDVDFEWYERPQILRYPPGGKYDEHADADIWTASTNSWQRCQDRDYSVILYLNEDYEGGQIRFTKFDQTLQPEPGMLLAFPSDHRYTHAVLPTTRGIRYSIVSWAAILGTPRVKSGLPFAAMFLRQKRIQA